jgi:hypothetical protein
MDNPKLPLIEKAKSIVEESSLSAEDKKLITERLPYAPTVLLQIFIDSCNGDQDALDILARSLKRKLMAGDDPIKLHQMIVEEKKELRKFILAHA